MKRLLLIIVLLFNLTIADTMYIATTSSSGSWNSVRNSCVSSGGDLVSVHSVEQDVALGIYKTDNGLFRPWIGGKAGSSGSNFNCPTFNFYWSDGTAWDYEPETFGCNDQGTYSGVYIHATNNWQVHPTHQAVGLCSYSSCAGVSGCTEISYGAGSVLGCTDPNAINYNPEATIDDNSCEYDCICSGEYNPVCGIDGNTYSNACEAECVSVNIDYEGECLEPNGGCTYEEAFNFDNTATFDDGSCLFNFGDINGDDQINIVDIVLIIQMILDDE